MKTYKNSNFKRDYECTNVKFIQSNQKPEGDMWEECNAQELTESNCMHLWSSEGNGKLYGYM
jgi:hypothetical protein